MAHSLCEAKYKSLFFNCACGGYKYKVRRDYNSCKSWMAQSNDDWIVMGNFVSSCKQRGCKYSGL